MNKVYRLQNCRIFALDKSVFSSARSGARVKTKSDIGERRSHARDVWGFRARRIRKPTVLQSSIAKVMGWSPLQAL